MGTSPDTTRSPTGRRDLLVVVGLVLALVLVRLALATAGSNTFDRGEEFVRASAATALVGGLDLPVARLFYHPYEGGGFVHALLTAGLMQVLGPSLLTHKLLAIGFEVLVLLAGLLLAREAFGRRAAGTFGLLWVLAPLAFQKVALLNLGIHYQALLFQFLLAWCGLGLLRGDGRRALLAGLVGGFGLFYNYQLAAMIGLLGLALLVTRSLDLKAWGRLVAGFLVGGLPLWLMALAVGGEVLDIHGQALGEAKPDAVGVGDVLRALGAWVGLRGWLQLLLLTGLALAPLAVSGLVPERARPARRALTTYLVLFAATAPFTGFLTAGFHDYFGAMRYAPLYAFALLLTAGSLAALVEAGGARRLAGLGMAGLLVLLGASSTLAARAEGFEPDPVAGLETLAGMRGTDYPDYFSKVASRLELSDAQKVVLLSSLEGVPRHELLPAVAEAVYRRSKRPLPELLAELRELDPEGWQDYLPGFGWWSIQGHRGDFANPVGRIRRGVQAALNAGVIDDGKPVRRLLQEGLGRVGLGPYPSDEVLHAELDQLIAKRLPEPIYRGLGQRALRSYVPAPQRIDALLAERPEPYRTWVREGFEDALERRRLP